MILKKYEKMWKRGIGNFLYRGNVTEISIEELKKMQTLGAVIIDVRSVQEYNEYHIDGSINVPIYDFYQKIENALKNKDEKIIVYCQSGIRSKKAISILNKKGYCNLYELSGGLDNI